MHIMKEQEDGKTWKQRWHTKFKPLLCMNIVTVTLKLFTSQLYFLSSFKNEAFLISEPDCLQLYVQIGLTVLMEQKVYM